MALPFTPEQFFRVFTDYNRAVWPAQLGLFALGVTLAIVGSRRRTGAARTVGLGLAVLWAWMGGVYHLTFFRAINPAALTFGVAFIAQAALFVAWSLRRPAAAALAAPVWSGSALLGYALVGYPLLGWLLGHRYPANPTFGVPCPTTIATLGLLVWFRRGAPWWLLPIPLLWVAVGTSAAFSFGMWEDLGLPVAGITALAAWWPARPRREAGMTTKRQFSAAEARSIGTRLGIDWSEIDLEQFRRGLAVELEHGARDPQTDVTHDDLSLTGKIAWAHLKEVRDYYTRLEAMEAAAEAG